jgi:hypothetical protein
MKPKHAIESPISPSVKRPDSSSESLIAARRAAQTAETNRTTMRRAFLIGGFAITAVFVYLEWMKPAPLTPGVLKVRDDRKPPAPEPVKDAPVQTAAVEKPQSAQPATEVIPPPVMTPPPSVEESITADVTTTESQKLAAEPDMLLTGPESRRDAATVRDKSLLKRAIDGKAWDAYRGLLARSIKAGLARIKQGQGLNLFDPLWHEPVFYQALLRWRTLNCFSESQISQYVNNTYTSGFITWLLNNSTAMEELLLTIRPKDDGGEVFRFLMETWSMNGENYQKYFPLALACAVVFDNPVSIPNPIGSKEYEAEATVNPMKRYLWYIEKNEKGKLAAPVHHSSARDLVWVVCAPVTTSEMEWSLRKMSFNRKSWGTAYGKVEYLMERAVEGLNPYKEYSFEEILKEGGVCGDRAYFCVNTARAQGIPAMIINGETNLGGHAWVGMKIDADEWTTAIGRVNGVSKGQTASPQTGEEVTEQEIQSWNDRHHQSSLVTLSIWRHFWLGDFFSATEDDENHTAAIQLANKLGPSFTESWAALYALLEKQTQLTGDPAVPNNLDEWNNFVRDMRREFKDNPRMAVLAANAELEYIFPYGEAGDAKRALLRERRRLNHDAGEQKDLVADSLKREADLILKRGGPNAKREISQLYDRALRDYGGSLTGFKMMAENYFGYFRDDKELSRKAARDIELAFKRVVETGSTDWFRANAESSIYKMICEYYRTAGDPERAEMLEKRYQILLRRAKRNAL